MCCSWESRLYQTFPETKLGSSDPHRILPGEAAFAQEDVHAETLEPLRAIGVREVRAALPQAVHEGGEVDGDLRVHPEVARERYSKVTRRCDW